MAYHTHTHTHPTLVSTNSNIIIFKNHLKKIYVCVCRITTIDLMKLSSNNSNNYSNGKAPRAHALPSLFLTDFYFSREREKKGYALVRETNLKLKYFIDFCCVVVGLVKSVRTELALVFSCVLIIYTLRREEREENTKSNFLNYKININKTRTLSLLSNITYYFVV